MESSSLSLDRLAAKQKRVREWQLFAEKEVSNPDLKKHMLDICTRFNSALAQLWEEGKVSDEQARNLRDLERQLNDVFEDARLYPASHG